MEEECFGEPYSATYLLNGVVCNQCREKLHVWLIESVRGLLAFTVASQSAN
jgi:hypothetical protein